ncbi:MAG: MMPL family transporter [Bacteroidia bacterium]
MGALFVSIYNFFERRRLVFFLTLGGLFLIMAFFASRVKLEEDISKALPKDKKIEKLNDVFQNSKFLDKFAFAVSFNDTTVAASPDSLIAYASRLNDELTGKLQPYFRKVTFRVDESVVLELFNNIREHLPVFLTEKDYAGFDSLISPEQIRLTLEQDLHTLSSPAGLVLKNMISRDPVGISVPALKKLQQLQVDENFELYDDCIITKDHKTVVLFATPLYPPSQTGKNGYMLASVDSVIRSLHAQSNGRIHASYFGATAVSAGNAVQLRKDSLYTQGITVIFLVLFIGLYFRKKRAPFLVLMPVAFGALFSLMCIYFLKGSISVIALATGSVVFGIAVNYSLHLFNHHRHKRDIREVLNDLSMPLTVGSFTTIGGFFCLQFVKSEMLRDLGLFTAFSLIGASLSTLIFLPHLIGSGNDTEIYREKSRSRLDAWSDFGLHHNKLLIGLIVLLTIVFGYTSRYVSFEADMMKMNYMKDDLRKAEAEFNRLNAFSLQSVYLVSEGKNLDQALSNNEQVLNKIEQLQEAGVVKKYSGVSALIISDSLQQLRIKRWNQFWTDEKKQRLLKNLEESGKALHFSSTAFLPFRELLEKSYTAMDRREMEKIKSGFLDDFITELPGKSTVVDVLKIQPGRKEELYAAFENDDHVTVIDKQYLTNRFVEIINSDFKRIAVMTSVLVFVVLLLTYGRLELALVSFIPMFITWIWILGLMGLFGIQFNIINIILSALIFGLGDDYSLFIMDGLLQEYKTGKRNLSSYKSSIILSAITTVAGLGVLIFAKHPALKSIALISIIGISCVVLISMALIPLLFHLLITKRTSKGRFPWTIKGIVLSWFAFAYFLLGSILLTVLGIVFVKLWIFGKERGKYIYHAILARFTWSLMYIMGNVKKRIINPQHEQFSKPAVVICNHQSFLDILSTVMLNPKIVLLTNEWVWKSPVFGAVVRMADYYPVAQGAEDSIERLADRVKQGYSIVVFPEGTRSVDGVIKRFHKGAFYLAEQLKLDILPILIHGTGYTMTKGDFLLKDGTITLKYLPRITPDDNVYGLAYAERAKKVGRYFREEYSRLNTEILQPKYFKEQLTYAYIYKGPILEWYMRVKVRLENYYQSFHDLLPIKGKILDAGCGYGFMSMMLKFLAPEREILGLDYDEEKTSLAAHNFNKPEGLQFQHADITTFEFGHYDGIVIADVLHYLQPEEQKDVLRKAIRSLNVGGVLIVRDGNADLQSRHRGTKLTEFFSTKVFSFNKTTAKGLSFLSGNTIREIAKSEGVSCEEMDEGKLTSNMLFVIRR